MRVAEYKQTGTETVTETVIVEDFNEYGELVGTHEEAVTREIPIMSVVYRDMTPEEEAEALRQQAEAEEYERTRPRTEMEVMQAKLDALMGYQGLTVQDLGGGVLEVVKPDDASKPLGDYLNPRRWVEGMEVKAGDFYFFDDYDYRLEATANGVPEAWGEPPFERV